MTEPLLDQMARPINPLIISRRTTSSPSVSSTRLSRRYMSEWDNFATEVLNIVSSLNVTGQHISLSDNPPTEGDHYVVANEMGVMSLFTANVAIPVSKAYTVTTAGTLVFGDPQAGQATSSHMPDISILHIENRDNCSLRAVGELKTNWTFHLEDYPINHPIRQQLVSLEFRVGQLVDYMRQYNLKYGFISTYVATVFVRRTDEYRFELSLPIRRSSTNPSLRECFLALGHLVQTDHAYYESPDFDDSLLSAGLGETVSSRSSRYRHTAFTSGSAATGSGNGAGNGTGHGTRHRAINDASTRMMDDTRHNEEQVTHVTSQTCFIGSAGIACESFVVKSILHAKKQSKTVYLVHLHGSEAVAKFFPVTLYESFLREVSTYELLQEYLPSTETGENYFPKFFGAGEVICSSMVPQGHVILLQKVPGVSLTHDIWESLGEAGHVHIHQGLRTAIGALRAIGKVNADMSLSNILYDKDTGSVTFIDFEHVIGNEDNCDVEDGPELYDVFVQLQPRTIG